MRCGTFQARFYSSQSHECSWRCAAWWGDCICLPTDPPLGWTHQANWSAMWGSGITARRAPLYGSSSFYTFCCITVQDNRHTYTHTHTHTVSNYGVSKQQVFHSMTLTSILDPQHLSKVQPTTLFKVHTQSSNIAIKRNLASYKSTCLFLNYF